MRLTHGLFVSLTLCAIPVAASAQTYRITALGSVPNALATTPNAINSRGDAAGGALTGDAGYALIWPRAGGVQVLPTLDGTNGTNRANIAFAINDHGDVAGESELATGQGFATLWTTSGSITALMPLAAYPQASYANGINNQGWIVGASVAEGRRGPSVATLWVNGTPTQLPMAVLGSQATGINDAGLIVGWNSLHAALWDTRAGTAVDLGTLPGGVQSVAEAINDLGQIVGNSDIANSPPSNPIQHPVLWEYGTITDLGLPNGFVDGSALAINDKGQVVGWSEQAQTGCTACDFATLWQNGSAVDLNTLIDPADPLKGTVQLEGAQGINNRGQIVATGISGIQTGAYLLTPVGN